MCLQSTESRQKSEDIREPRVGKIWPTLHENEVAKAVLEALQGSVP